MDAPPFNTEAEAGVLGCLMAPEGDCYNDAIAAGLKRDWFYDLRHATVFRAIEEIEASGTPVSFQMVRQKLEPSLLEAGGVAYLLTLQNDSTPSPTFLPIWLEQCRDAVLKRKAVVIATRAIDLAHGTDDGESVLNSMADSSTAAVDATSQKDSAHGKILASRLVDALEIRRQLADSGQRSGICTGLPKLDEMTDGLQFGEQFIIGARPSAGKTAMGLTLVAEIAIRKAVPTLIISCEMSTESLLMRLCAVCSGITLSTLRRGAFQEADMPRLTAFNARLSTAPLYIFDAVGGITGDEASAVIRQHARMHGVKCVLVDYLQKIRADKKSEKRTYEVAEVSHALRSAAVRSKVALVTLAQLSREPEKGTEPRAPRLADLADSAQIERDADTIALLHRDKQDQSKAMLLIAKQRDGKTGMLNLDFNGELTEFREMDPIEQADREPNRKPYKRPHAND